EAVGAEVVGPVANIPDALRLVASETHLDGAVLDINLQGEMAYPVADALIARGVPFVFATGYDRASVPDRYAHVTRCEKPVDPRLITKVLAA
ncbi:MAG: response regulator, partial [Methylobacteriaceae bacterium]|nr:response regulator [Methylobacteriaceae bacterium]